MCEKKVRDFFKSSGYIPDSLLIAVSGGSDSVALLHLCMRLTRELNIKRIGVAHINYGMRGEASDNEEKFVKELADRYGCKKHFKRLSGMDLSQHGVEENARNERYSFFKSICEKHEYRYTATGHTLDDCVESVMLNLIRGTGLNGLEGIKSRREDSVIRPMLSLRRSELRAWLRKNGYEWKEDFTNNDTKYMRNWVRHELLPLIKTRKKDIYSSLVKLSETSRGLKKSIMPLTDDWKNRYHVRKSESIFFIRIQGIKKDGFICRESLCSLFREYGIPVSMRHINRVVEKGAEGKAELLPAGWSFIKYGNGILFFREKAACPFSRKFSYRLEIPGILDCPESLSRIKAQFPSESVKEIMFDRRNLKVFCDYKKTGKELFYRSAHRGDRFRPLGLSSDTGLRRVIKNARIPGFFRDNYGVVADSSDSVVWIPGVALGHDFRCTQDTEEVLQLSFSSELFF